MSYHRVAPRDIFNEAHMMNNIAKLAEMATKQKTNIRANPEFDPKAFDFNIDTMNHELISTTPPFLFEGEIQGLYINMYRRDKWCLEIRDNDDEMIECFNDNGKLSDQFLETTKAFETPQKAPNPNYFNEANFMTRIGKLAFKIIQDEINFDGKLQFKETLYGEEGIQFKPERNFLVTTQNFISIQNEDFEICMQINAPNLHKWTLFLWDHVGEEYIDIFTSDGTFSKEFEDFVQR